MLESVTFPVSGVETWPWLPPLVAFAVSLVTSMVGVSGAFLVLPFQMSVLHFTSPAVSATNLVFNLVATPGGIYRYLREGRMVWPLAGVVAAGTLPGVVIGYVARVRYLPDPQAFKLFAGIVLLYLGYRLWASFLAARRVVPLDGALTGAGRPAASTHDRVQLTRVSATAVEFTFRGRPHRFNTPGMLLLAFVVGVIGGTYGIGGGAIIAPFCVTWFGLPVHAVAGAALLGTLLTSVFGVIAYSVLPAPEGLAVGPDWALGALFGLGGLGGMYAGARLQKHVPAATLRLFLAVILLGLGAHYVLAGAYSLTQATSSSAAESMRAPVAPAQTANTSASAILSQGKSALSKPSDSA